MNEGVIYMKYEKGIPEKYKELLKLKPETEERHKELLSNIPKQHYAQVVASLKYKERFGDGFPTYETGISEPEQYIEAIIQCLEKGKDAIEVFDVDVDSGLIY